MRISKVSITLMIVMLLFAVSVFAEEAISPKPQTMCAVSGKSIDKSFYLDYEGKRIYACSQKSLDALKKNPEMYVKKIEDSGITLEKRQTTCPLMGRKINKQYYADSNGKRVYFCCPGCIGLFKKAPEKYVKKIESEGITLEKTQTTCPIMGRKINKDYYADHNGKRIYFCCPECIGQFKKDPEKYVKKLESEGITLEKTPSVEEKAGKQ